MKKLFAFIVAAIALLLALTFISNQKTKEPPQSKKGSLSPSQEASRIETVADNLEIPWALAFLPINDILFTQRTGTLGIISQKNVTTIAKVEDVKVYGEGGLLGLALHPDFSSNHYIYLYLTYSGNGNNTLNRVVRYKFENNSLSDKKIIIDSIPGALFHNGGRLKFGPDKFLYITAGDSQNPSLAQNKNSLAGKILRVTDEGKTAPGNPFGNLVYSYGHRNPQGLAWDSSGRLFETEHGNSHHDEVNIIIKGGNYGWPEIEGNEKRDGMITPIANSGEDTWAPSGATFLNGVLFFGGLRGEALFELRIENDNAIISQHLKNEYGRMRDVVLGPDNLLYTTTSNRDGRGLAKDNDDKILRVNPSKL